MSILNINRSLTLAGRIFDVSHPTEPVIELPKGKPALPIRQTKSPLPRATPEEVGISSAAVLEFARLLESNDEINTHSVMLLRNGRVFFEHSFGARDINCPGYVFSCSKSFVSIAVGLLYDDGVLDLDADVEAMFPHKISTIAKLSPRVVTVRDLLTMKSGVSFNEADCMSTPEWTKEFITSAAIGENGREFFYNSMNTYMLAAIVVKKCGRSLTSLLTERLFAPLDITDIFWEKGPENVEKGGWGLYIRPEDMAKVGIMLQNRGVYNGKRILSEKYVNEACRAHARAPEGFGDFNYGYQLWVGRSRHTVLFNGMLGQNMHIDMENGVICITYAGNTDSFQRSELFDYIKRFFNRDFPDSLPPSEDHERLQKHFGKAEAHPLKSFFKNLFRKKAELPEECRLLDGAEFVADKSGCVGLFPFTMQVVFNSYATGIKGISFGKANGKFFITYSEREATFTLPIGFGSPEHCEVNVYGDTFRLAVLGVFTRDMRGRTVLGVRYDFLELPSTGFLTLTLTHEGAELKQSELPGKGLISSVLRSQTEERPSNVIFSSLLEKLDNDTFEYKLSQLFEPTVRLIKKNR